MSTTALKRETNRGKAVPDRTPALHAVPARQPRRPSIKVYTGSQELKEAIEKAADDDRPGQGAGAYLLRLHWQHQKTLKAETDNGSRSESQRA